MNRRGFFRGVLGGVAAMFVRPRPVAPPVNELAGDLGGFVVPERFARAIERHPVIYGKLQQVLHRGDSARCIDQHGQEFTVHDCHGLAGDEGAKLAAVPFDDQWYVTMIEC